jgi:hypothetical protein
MTLQMLENLPSIDRRSSFVRRGIELVRVCSRHDCTSSLRGIVVTEGYSQDIRPIYPLCHELISIIRNKRISGYEHCDTSAIDREDEACPVRYGQTNHYPDPERDLARDRPLN